MALAWTAFAIVVLIGTTSPNNVDNKIAAGILLLPALFFLWCLWRFYLRHLPVATSSEGIKSFFFGKNEKYFLWKDIKKIERIRYYDGGVNMYVHTYRFYESEDYIRFDDGLAKIKDLLAAINPYIRQYNIEITAFDRGLDTMKKIARSNIDPEEKKKLLREGVRETLSEL
jgi:hypothetical protein